MSFRISSVVWSGALSFVVAAAPFPVGPAWAWGGGHGGGAVVHAAPGGVNGGYGGGGYHAVGGPRIGGRGLPPLSGIIRERAGAGSVVTLYGHTGTAVRFGGGARPSPWGFGHTATAVTPNGVRVARGFGRRAAFDRRLATRERFGRYGYGGLGRYGYGAYGFGGYGADGYGGDGPAGGFGSGGWAGGGGSYGIADGGAGGFGAGGDAGSGPGIGDGYASEVPLAARFAEAPLAPGPGTPVFPDDRYAYAAPEDVGPGPRIVTVRSGAARDCRCGSRLRSEPERPRIEPVVYRYGVGTAY